ncbi:MAG: DUF2190 family protein [Deltaproteobacteria bacterium]|jgi:predicted RecA/RadA family phage recombinase|nr:DUF2190 family protein [Deltaproteobacteria bacterium]
MQNSVRAGRCIDYTAQTDVKGGDLIVLSGFVAVASTDIPAGATGACEVEGVYALPKGNEAIIQGVPLYWTGTAVTATKPEDGTGFVGSAWEAAAAPDATVAVRINFGSVPVSESE